MLELTAAILALFVGPFLDRFSDARGPTRAALDAFTFVAMLGLILGLIIPDAYELAGPWSLAVAALAWFGPTILEHRVRSLAARAHLAAMLMGAVGLIIHGAFDGMALVDLNAADGEDHALALAVILHRIPAGLTIWWLIAPRWGHRRALFTLLGLAATTVFGFSFASTLAGNVTASQAGYFQALVGGALLHVIVHRTGHDGGSVTPRRRKVAAMVGTLLAGLLLYWMFAQGEHVHVGIEGGEHIHRHDAREVEPATPVDDDHAGHDHGDEAGHDDHAGHDHDDETDPDDHTGHDHEDEADSHAGHAHGDDEAMAAATGHEGHDHGPGGPGFLERLLHLALQSAPALVLAFFMAGLIQVFLPKQSVAWMARGGNFKRALKGLAFGLPLPICSCGVVPVYKSLVNRGVPAAAGLAFLVATPELGIDAILLSWPLLGGEMAILRVVAAALVALLVGVLVARFNKGLELDRPLEIEEEPEQGSKMRRALEIGWVGFFDGTFPWILLGLVVAAVCEPLLDENAFATYSSLLQVPFFALLGMPVYVCAAGATPLVAVFLAKGVSPGAALAFLLTGPATNITTFGLLQRLHGKKTAIAFVAVVIGATVSLGLATDFFFAPQFEGAGLSSEHAHDANLLQYACLGVLGLATLGSVFRQGPQGFAAHVLTQAGESGEGHDHHHDEAPTAEKKSCCH